MKRIAMNQEERDWLEWLKRAQDGVVSQRQAAEKMGVSERWVRKLLVRMTPGATPALRIDRRFRHGPLRTARVSRSPRRPVSICDSIP